VKQFKKDYEGHYVAVDQIFVLSFQKSPIIVTIDKVLGADDGFVFLAS
jgi:hypothetical protein